MNNLTGDNCRYITQIMKWHNRIKLIHKSRFEYVLIYIVSLCDNIWNFIIYHLRRYLYILNIIYIIMTLEIYKIWLNLTVINNSVIDDDKTYRSMIFIGWQDLYRSSSQQAKARSTKEKGRLFYGDCPNLEKKRTSSHQRLCCRAGGKDEASAPYSPRKKISDGRRAALPAGD